MSGGGAGGDALLFGLRHLAARLIGDILHPRGEDGAAMGAGQDALVAELVKILANGLRRDAVARGKLLDSDPPQLARQRNDLLMSEVACHWSCSHGVSGPILRERQALMSSRRDCHGI